MRGGHEHDGLALAVLLQLGGSDSNISSMAARTSVLRPSMRSTMALRVVKGRLRLMYGAADLHLQLGEVGRGRGLLSGLQLEGGLGIRQKEPARAVESKTVEVDQAALAGFGADKPRREVAQGVGLVADVKERHYRGVVFEYARFFAARQPVGRMSCSACFRSLRAVAL